MIAENPRETEPQELTWRVIVAVLLKKNGGKIAISHKEAAAIMDSEILITHLPDGISVVLGE